MSCLSTSTKADIQAKIVRMKEQLEIANDTLDSAVGNEILEYRFDSGEGSQRTQYKTPKQLTGIIDWLESRINYLTRKLNGTGLANFNMRRKQSFYGRPW